MKRSEQDIRFQWDLTKIYPDTAAWEAAMQEAEAALAPLAAIPGTLGTSKEAFKKGLDTIYASMFKVELPYTYAFLKKTEDGSVAENQEMAARGESLIIKFNAAIAFLSPEILAIPAEKLDEWMQDEGVDVKLTIDRPQEGWDGHVGFVPTYVKELNPDLNYTVVMCGPPIMIKFTLGGLKELGFKETQVYTTMELRMKCGVGKCGRCNIGSKYVCKDGPVFRFDELDELPDEY